MRDRKKAKRESMTSIFFIFFVVGIVAFFMIIFALFEGGFTSDFFFFLFPLFFSWIWGYGVWKWYKEYRLKTKLKKYWNVKNCKIIEVKRKWGSITNNHLNYDWYVLISEDWKNLYESSVIYVRGIDDYARVWDLIPVYLSQDVPVRYRCDVDNIIVTSEANEIFEEKQDEDMEMFEKLSWESLVDIQWNDLLKNWLSYLEYFPSIIFCVMWFIVLSSVLPVLLSIDISKLFDLWYLESFFLKDPELLFFLLLAVIFIWIWVFNFVKVRRKYRLINSWVKIMATITDIKKKHWKNTYYVIYATDWTNSFKSDSMFSAPFQVGEKIPVYIDEFDSKKYRVDIGADQWLSLILKNIKAMNLKINNKWKNKE